MSLGGISTGGRVINERPHQILIDKAVDVDIVSAYVPCPMSHAFMVQP